MKRIILFFTLFAISVNAQIVNLKITDFSDNLPLDDADIYFKNSTKNFVSDQQGKAIIDLSNVSKKDELIVSKKDYQDAILKVSDLKSELSIKLEKVSEVELKEAFVTNLKVEDILKKLIENYDKNFNTDEHFYKVNFKRDAVVDSVNRDLIDVDLQFRFKKRNVKIHSNNVVNERIIGEGSVLNRSYSMYQYFNNISLLEVTKRMLNRFVEKYYDDERVQISKYADKYMYEIEFSNKQSKVVNWFLIDKETFAIVEHQTKMENIQQKNSENVLVYYDMIFKYRPYQGKWILKETSSTSSAIYLDEEKSQHIFDVKVNLEVKDFSMQPFPEFNKLLNEKMDIRRSFK
ncbi:hypothetical protein HXZ94_03950 [Empedobacter falsenii]|uniref:hypothetical protein n=1 Tax=Empedobacter falsenii TaxID=343874 RepID=UPI0025772F7B|nr:hypothetical protein [Empedobacter falsenii]MDM1297655.1 hypothetical protein [Empedobacter falsenii]MDM1317715.1 hypothetical protein [Empedobacter falsenii]